MVNATARPKILIIGNRRSGKTALATLLGSSYDCRELVSIPAAISVGTVVILVFSLEPVLGDSNIVFDRLNLLANRERTIVYVNSCETVAQRTAALTVLQDLEETLVLGTSDQANKMVYNDTVDALVAAIREKSYV